MSDKENVQPQRRSSVPATIGAFLRRPLAPILPLIPKIVAVNSTEPAVPNRAKVARSASMPSVSALTDRKTTKAEVSFKKPLTVEETSHSTGVPDVAFSCNEKEAVPDAKHATLQPIQEAENELERSEPKRPAVWAPVAQPGKNPSKSSDSLDFLCVVSKDEEPADEMKIARKKSNNWVLNYEPYFAESIQLQLSLEGFSDCIEPSCSRSMRSILVDWLAMLQTFLKQRPAALHLGVRVFDQILATHIVESKELQLVALASFWIGSKLDSQNLHVNASKLLSMCKNAYSRRILLKTEVSIIKGLDFCLPRETSHTIVTYHVLQLELTDKQRSEVRHLAGYFLDVFLFHWEAFFTPASNIASAATLCALEILQIAAYRPMLDVAHHTLVSSPSWLELCTLDSAFKPVESIAKLLAEMMKLMGEVNASDSSFEGIRHKNHLLREHFRAKLTPSCIEQAYQIFSIFQ